MPAPVPPLSLPEGAEEHLFDYLKGHDVLLHHPYKQHRASSTPT